jgi:oligosaccharide repeat unit polymerase
MTYDCYQGYYLSYKTYIAVVLSMTAYLIGWAISKKRLKKTYRTMNSDKKLEILMQAITIFNMVAMFIAIPSIIENGFTHRQILFADDFLLGNKIYTFIYNYVIQVIILSSIIITFCINDKYKKYKKYGYINLIMISIITLGRFPIYYIIYFMIIDRLNNSNKLKLVRSILMIAFIFYIAFYILNIKLMTEGENYNINETINYYLLNYHIIGFHMIDNYINSNNLDYIYPSTSLGIVGWYLHLLTKYSILLPEFPNSFMELMDIINKGFYFPELGKNYNAFSTSIIPFYADGGFIGIFVGFSFYGWLSTRGNLFDLYATNPYFLSVVFMLTFSIFQPFINLALPGCFLFIWVFNKWIAS